MSAARRPSIDGLSVRVQGARTELLLSDGSSMCVIFVVQGSLRLMVSGEDRLIRESEYVVVDGRRRPRGRIADASPAQPFVSVALALDGVEVQKIASVVGVSASTGVAVGAGPSLSNPDLQGALTRMLEATRSPRDRAVLVPIYRYEVLYRLLQGDQRHRLLDMARGCRSEQPLTAVFDYIDHHLNESIAVADLAAVARLSVSALTALFTTATGRPPYQFVKDRRLERARELLEDTDLDVTTVAHRVGYSSVSHFISQFRARHGVTPRSYAVRDRRQSRTGSPESRGARGAGPTPAVKMSA
ncbi:helix-turn-helix domain-containing protein [Microbacterium sp. PA5]|uniref:AraC family transcriptional regulator n=1 Tax=Microbacterium sp. PA5 TaxID=3416654 RepID=UPI003CE8C22D